VITLYTHPHLQFNSESPMSTGCSKSGNMVTRNY